MPERDYIFVSSRRDRYRGFMKPYLKIAEQLRAVGMTERQIAAKLYDEHGVRGDPSYDAQFSQDKSRESYIVSIASVLSYVDERYGSPRTRRGEDYYFARARREYAAMLRLEGLLLREIASRLGVCTPRARELVEEGFRDMKHTFERSVGKLRFTITRGGG